MTEPESRDGRTHMHLKSYLNGRWDAMDADVRLALTVIASELDGLNANTRATRKVVTWVGGLMVSAILSLTVTLLASSLG